MNSEFVLFLTNSIVLEKNALLTFLKFHSENPSSQIIYSDEEKFSLVKVACKWEQIPTIKNKIVLSDELDNFGLNKIADAFEKRALELYK